jgi:ubiquinone/menaquinone biosynthesis C-methylase UbiE
VGRAVRGIALRKHERWKDPSTEAAVEFGPLRGPEVVPGRCPQLGLRGQGNDGLISPVRLLNMFDKSAHLYDLAYSFKDYAGESAWVRDAIHSRVPRATSLLDVACGTGKHLEHLRSDFDCQGLDLNPEFVELAQQRTGVKVHGASMDSFDLDERFDAVVCLFSSIGYTSDLTGAVGSMARHLNPGGVLIVEPWLRPDQWVAGHVQVLDQESDGIRLVRMTTSRVDGSQSILEMHYLVGSPSGIEHLGETHRLTLFSLAEYESAFLASALTFEFDHDGPNRRGAMIGLAS